MARHVDEAVAGVLAAYEGGLKAHAEILRRTVLSGFWGRLRWLVFGAPTTPNQVRGRFAQLRDRLLFTDLRAKEPTTDGQ